MSDLQPIDRDYLLRELRELLPDPVSEETQLDGDVVLVGGDPGEVIVRISSGKVSIAVFSIQWEGPHTPVVRPKPIATLNWQRLPASTTMMAIHELVRAVVELRRSKYRTCGRCGETNPPECMRDDQTGQSCAERDLGVIH